MQLKSCIGCGNGMNIKLPPASFQPVREAKIFQGDVSPCLYLSKNDNYNSKIMSSIRVVMKLLSFVSTSETTSKGEVSVLYGDDFSLKWRINHPLAGLHLIIT